MGAVPEYNNPDGGLTKDLYNFKTTSLVLYLKDLFIMPSIACALLAALTHSFVTSSVSMNMTLQSVSSCVVSMHSCPIK